MIDFSRMQLGQARHDAVAHASVLGWPLEKRLCHYFLHWGKYAWSCGAARRSKQPLATTIVVDAMIIALAAANALEIKVFELPALGDQAPTDSLASLETSLTEAIGPLFKIFEGIDHGETVPAKSAMIIAAVRIAAAVQRYADQNALNLARLIEARWQQIEDMALV